FTQSMLADGAQHVVRAEAPGYAPGTAILLLEKDADVTITLEHLTMGATIGAATRKPGRPTAALPPTMSTKPPAAIPEKNCDPPYALDANGIKHIKPECM